MFPLHLRGLLVLRVLQGASRRCPTVGSRFSMVRQGMMSTVTTQQIQNEIHLTLWPRSTMKAAEAASPAKIYNVYTQVENLQVVVVGILICVDLFRFSPSAPAPCQIRMEGPAPTFALTQGFGSLPKASLTVYMCGAAVRTLGHFTHQLANSRNLWLPFGFFKGFLMQDPSSTADTKKIVLLRKPLRLKAHMCSVGSGSRERGCHVWCARK